MGFFLEENLGLFTGNEGGFPHSPLSSGSPMGGPWSGIGAFAESSGELWGNRIQLPTTALVRQLFRDGRPIKTPLPLLFISIAPSLFLLVCEAAPIAGFYTRRLWRLYMPGLGLGFPLVLGPSLQLAL